MRSRPRITVVTVVYNNLSGLQQTRASILEQNSSPWQHIVIDGGSSDGTRQWLEASLTGPGDVWVSEPDHGLYDAMNKGVKYATGDIVQFLNGGDVYEDRQVLADVEAAWIAGDWRWSYGQLRLVDEYGATVREYSHFPFNRRKVELARDYVPHPSTFMETDLLKRIGGFDSNFGNSADQLLLLKAATISPPHVSRSIWVRFALGGVSSNSSERQTILRYHRIRRELGSFILASRTVDRAFAEVHGCARETRSTLGEFSRRNVRTKRLRTVLSYCFQDWSVNKSRSISAGLALFRLTQLLRGPAARNSKSVQSLGLFASLVYRVYAQFLLSIELPWQVQCGPRLSIQHGRGLVVHKDVTIGQDCVLRHNVTLGVRGTALMQGGVPHLGDHVDVGAGALILGGCTIGSHASIGAGAVVLKDVPLSHVAVGNPARVLPRIAASHD